MIPLDVLIRADGKFIAAAQAAAFEHSAPVGRSHALAKAMYPHAASGLGLIRSFRHDIRSSLTYR
jgi:hypothetical protein